MPRCLEIAQSIDNSNRPCFAIIIIIYLPQFRTINQTDVVYKRQQECSP